jgi:hypothetical protein
MRKLKNYKPTRFMAETSHYSKQMADFAVMFIEQLCHTKGTWAGKPFELIDWQEQIIRDLFGAEAQRLPAVQYGLHRDTEEDGQVRACRCGRPAAHLRRR